MTEYCPSECEACNSSGKLTRVNGLWLCDRCASLEFETIGRMHSSDKMQQVRVTKANELMEQSRKVDTSLQVRTDIFNARTIEIAEIKKAIDADTSIENKQYELAKILTEKLNQYKKIIFDANEAIMDAATSQRATQSYLNNLANTLRAEEREALRLADISYQPKPVLKPIKPATISRKKFDKAELKKYASELGISEFTLQAVVIQRNCTVEEAANALRRSIKEGQSEVK